MKISVSFLKNKTGIEDTLRKIDATDADYIHVDIMDGKFVPEKGMNEYEFFDCLKDIKKPLDIHLMVENPLNYIMVLKDLHPEFIIIHSEIKDFDVFLDLIHSYGIKAGIALKPETRVGNVKYLDKADYVLVLGVNPGKGGQKMIMDTVSKLEVLQQLKHEKNYNYVVSFDGGVNLDTRGYLNSSDILVSGSFICMSDDFQKSIDALK